MADAYTSTESDGNGVGNAATADVMDSDLEASIDLMESSILGFHSKLDSMSEEMTSLSDRLTDEQHRNRVLAGQVTSLQEKVASDGAVVQQYVTDMLKLVNLTQIEESSQHEIPLRYYQRCKQQWALL